MTGTLVLVTGKDDNEFEMKEVANGLILMNDDEVGKELALATGEDDEFGFEMKEVAKGLVLVDDEVGNKLALATGEDDEFRFEMKEVAKGLVLVDDDEVGNELALATGEDDDEFGFEMTGVTSWRSLDLDGTFLLGRPPFTIAGIISPVTHGFPLTSVARTIAFGRSSVPSCYLYVNKLALGK